MRKICLAPSARVLWSALLAVIVVIFAVGSAAAQSGPSWTPELTMTVKRVSSVMPSPDGTKVAFVVAEAVMDGREERVAVARPRRQRRRVRGAAAHARREVGNQPALVA